MPLPEAIQRRVAHIDVSIHAFHQSLAHWRLPSDDGKRWSNLVNPTQPLLIGADDALDIDSDCAVRVSAPDGGMGGQWISYWLRRLGKQSEDLDEAFDGRPC